MIRCQNTIRTHWVPKVTVKCASCQCSFGNNQGIVEHLRGKCGAQGVNMYNEQDEQIHIISSYQSESNELETWEKLLELYASTGHHSREMTVRQQLEHYTKFKLTYLSTPSKKSDVENKLVKHLAEIALDWMIVASQGENEPIVIYECHICHHECKKWIDKDRELAVHILYATSYIICILLTFCTEGITARWRLDPSHVQIVIPNP